MSTIIRKATIADIPQLEQLVNSAYRGESARKGWTHEADLIEGSLRTDAVSLKSLIENPGAVILLHLDGDEITGCVLLEKKGLALYLGMLSVLPEGQARGIGKKLLAAAEDQARSMACDRVEMKVIMSRTVLIEWYKRHGYEDTGRTEPFLVDNRFGVPRSPVHFVVLQKMLS